MCSFITICIPEPSKMTWFEAGTNSTKVNQITFCYDYIRLKTCRPQGPLASPSFSSQRKLQKRHDVVFANTPCYSSQNRLFLNVSRPKTANFLTNHIKMLQWRAKYLQSTVVAFYLDPMRLNTTSESSCSMKEPFYAKFRFSKITLISGSVYGDFFLRWNRWLVGLVGTADRVW